MRNLSTPCTLRLPSNPKPPVLNLPHPSTTWKTKSHTHIHHSTIQYFPLMQHTEITRIRKKKTEKIKVPIGSHAPEEKGKKTRNWNKMAAEYYPISFQFRVTFPLVLFYFPCVFGATKHTILRNQNDPIEIFGLDSLIVVKKAENWKGLRVNLMRQRWDL